ncbi:MAG: hypothetical protein QM718_14090 [Steroidobacteraceae bacterium]
MLNAALAAGALLLGWRYLLAAAVVFLSFLSWFVISLNGFSLLSGYWLAPLRILLCVVLLALAATFSPNRKHVHATRPVRAPNRTLPGVHLTA